jgi:hypothetical protein
VLVDDEVVGMSPLSRPLPISMGSRRFRARKSGFIEATAQKELEGGRAAAVSLVLRPEVHEGHLVVAASAGDTITIDGQSVGQGRFDGSVRSGSHVIDVSAAGRKRQTISIVIRDGEQRDVAVALERESSNRWMLYLAGGVAAAAGLVVGGYFLFRPTTPPTTPGTAGTFDLP